MVENSGRQSLHPADVFIVFRILLKAGRSIEDVAANSGVSPLVVRRRLKLGNVCPEFLEEYRADRLTLDHLMAFAVSDDYEKQKLAWESLLVHQRSAYALRRVLSQSDVSAREPMARFVGLKAYEKAGGQVRRDLFPDEDSVFFLDAILLNRLAHEKLSEKADALKAGGLAWVEVMPHLQLSDLAAFGRVGTALRDPTAEEAARLAELEAERERLEAELAEGSDDRERLNELEGRLDVI